jgi:Small metal-binding protein
MLGLGLALFLFLMPQVSLAAEDHIAEAITYATEAVDHGKMGHPNVLATHAELALANATASEKAKANSHTEEAIKHLEQAIDEGKNGHADVATTQAEVALTVQSHEQAPMGGPNACIMYGALRLKVLQPTAIGSKRALRVPPLPSF